MLNVWFADEMYSDVQELNIGDNAVAVSVDSQTAEVRLVDNLDVLLIESDPDELDDCLCRVDKMIEDIKRLIKIYDYEYTEVLISEDDDNGQLILSVGLNLFEI